MKKLNTLPIMMLIIAATLLITYCWKQQQTIEGMVGGNIQKTLDSNQYNK